MEARINVISREMIKPSTPTPIEKRKLKFSLLDQIQPQYFIPLLVFYEKQNASDSEKANTNDPHETTLRLKRSLSECLTKFYPLAGKLNPNNLWIDCDDSGALFVEARVCAPLSQEMAKQIDITHCLPLDPLSFGHDDDRHQPLARDCEKTREEILLAVQITWFECGSNVIGVCLSHKFADFMSLISFVNSWAALNRGEATKLQPNFDVGRSVFPPCDRSDISTPLAEPKGKIVKKRLVFSKEKLTELKQLASSSSALVKDPTRVEVVTAFIWNHLINISRAKRPGATTLTSNLFHAVNLRSRMPAALAPKNDEFPFGNISTVVPASFTTSNDDENQEKRGYYGDLVRHVRDAIRKVNEDYVFSRVIPFIHSRLAARQQQPTSPIFIDAHFFTSWCGFPMYDVDFGWGRPSTVGPATGTGAPGIMLKNTRDGEGIEAWITMLEDESTLLPDEVLSLESPDFFDLN